MSRPSASDSSRRSSTRSCRSGWAVRTTRDCVEQAAQDLTIRTTMLDGRFVAGSEELGNEFDELVRTQLAVRDVAGFVDGKLAESSERQARMGGSVFMLEPNVKDGQGGLRDMHTLLWIARVKKNVTRSKGSRPPRSRPRPSNASSARARVSDAGAQRAPLPHAVQAGQALVRLSGAHRRALRHASAPRRMARPKCSCASTTRTRRSSRGRRAISSRA